MMPFSDISFVKGCLKVLKYKYSHFRNFLLFFKIYSLIYFLTCIVHHTLQSRFKRFLNTSENLKSEMRKFILLTVKLETFS